MKKDESLLLLKSELDGDWSFIRESYAENRKMTARLENSPGDEMAVIAVAYTLHNLYTAFEGYFYRVAKFFENQLDTESWHRELISRMALDIQGIRPALLKPESSEDFDELRKFRHVFRNLYKSKLRPDRVISVNECAVRTVDAFGAAHAGFTAFLDDLTAREGGER